MSACSCRLPQPRVLLSILLQQYIRTAQPQQFRSLQLHLPKVLAMSMDAQHTQWTL